MSDNFEPFSLPYTDILGELLDSIFDALLHLSEADGNPVTDRDISKYFLWLNDRRQRGRDEHLFQSRIPDRSLRATRESNVPEESRIGQIVLTAYHKAAEDSRASSTTGVLLPSPLKILIDFLTVPEEPASRAYAFTSVRSYLLQKMSLSIDFKGTATGGNFVTVESTVEAVRTAQTYYSRRDNIHTPVTDVPKQFVYHIMATSGILNLRFKNAEAQRAFLKSHSIFQMYRSVYEFRVSSTVERIPEVSEVINQIWGVPLPIRGAEAVFFGGLKFSTDGGLVLAVTGRPGTGKTSFGLFLGTVLAPLGARTFFLTMEEEPTDLRFRLTTLTPEYLQRLSIYDSNDDQWFKAWKLSATKDVSPGERLRSILIELKKAVNRSGAEPPAGAVPLACPFVVVLDGIQNYFLKSFYGSHVSTKYSPTYSLESFVDDCRALGALVIINSADRQAELEPLEYLVDVLIDLEYRHTDMPGEKPVRYFVLRKTRHQVSRPGAHVCHFSGSEGFRIAPQLPSQLDRRSINKILEPSAEAFIDFLNRPFYGAPPSNRPPRNTEFNYVPDYLKIPRRSHVLIHGRGSTGKAGFALSLLAAPSVNDNGDVKLISEHNKVLVVSFLYPDDYYTKLLNEITPIIRAQYDLPKEWKTRISVQHFVAGYLNPEDLFSKVMRLLDQAELEGEPFTGLLFDGLHNTFLQFPRLEENGMVWPMLYGMLRTRDLTVVATHTTFSLGSSDEDYVDQMELALRRAKPMLHALVQAADFYLQVDRPMFARHQHAEESDSVDEIVIKVLSARGQPIPEPERYWHRERLIVYGYAVQPQLPLKPPARRQRKAEDADRDRNP